MGTAIKTGHDNLDYSLSGRFQGEPEACVRLHAKFGESWRSLAKVSKVWRRLANLKHNINQHVAHIHQGFGEGSPRSPEFSQETRSWAPEPVRVCLGFVYLKSFSH